MNRFNTILFDLDGTLTASELGITTGVKYALEELGVEVKDRKELLKFIGPPLKTSFKEFYGFDDETIQEGIRLYRVYYDKQGYRENEVYEGIREMLEALKNAGKEIIVATSKPEYLALMILEHFELKDYFDYIAGSSKDGKLVRKGDVIKYALSHSKYKDLSEVVMVGDRFHDIEGARENNIKVVGVCYGYGNREEHEKYGADFIVDTVEELKQFLLEN